jgi:hypothetical protein
MHTVVRIKFLCLMNYSFVFGRGDSLVVSVPELVQIPQESNSSEKICSDSESLKAVSVSELFGFRDPSVLVSGSFSFNASTISVTG